MGVEGKSVGSGFGLGLGVVVERRDLRIREGAV